MTFHNFKNLTGLSDSQVLSSVPPILEGDSFIALPDFEMNNERWGNARLPVGCSIRFDIGKVPSWWQYTSRDPGCGIAVYKSSYTLQEFLRNKESFDALGDKLRSRKTSMILNIGEGNHFIEVLKDSDDNIYFVIHSGSHHNLLRIDQFWQTYEGFLQMYNIRLELAQENRELLADYLTQCLPGLALEKILEAIHNSYEMSNSTVTIRKGTIPIEGGALGYIASSVTDNKALYRTLNNIVELGNTMSHGTGYMFTDLGKKSRSLEEFFILMQQYVVKQTELTPVTAIYL